MKKHIWMIAIPLSIARFAAITFMESIFSKVKLATTLLFGDK
jgi:hypothetical protein